MKYAIKDRWTGSVLFEADIECSTDETDGVRLGLAVRFAIKADANLGGANLTRAYLADANLTDANLTRAYLADANLTRAYLAGANLTDANLGGAKWRDGITITRAPLQLYGLTYPVTVLDAHMQIGCELHTFDEWGSFDDERISRMDGTLARRFWRDHKEHLMALCRSRSSASPTPSNGDRKPEEPSSADSRTNPNA